jgi:hypothetical protein
MQSNKTRLLSINMYSINTRSMETRYHHHHGHNIPHCGGEGVFNTANRKANDRTLMQFISLSSSILGVCRCSKYARWRDTIDEDDPWILGLSSMIKPSTAPDYIYDMLPWFEIVCGGWRSFFFAFRHNYLLVSVKNIFFRVWKLALHSELWWPRCA